MKLFLVTNELESDGPGRFEAVYVVAAETPEEALERAKRRGGEGVVAQHVRPLRFEPDQTALVWMGLVGGTSASARGRVKKQSGMRVDR